MGVGGSRKTNIEGGLPKEVGGGAWTVCKFKRGQGLGKKEGVVFLRGKVVVDTPMHTMN